MLVPPQRRSRPRRQARPGRQAGRRSTTNINRNTRSQQEKLAFIGVGRAVPELAVWGIAIDLTTQAGATRQPARAQRDCGTATCTPSSGLIPPNCCEQIRPPSPPAASRQPPAAKRPTWDLCGRPRAPDRVGEAENRPVRMLCGGLNRSRPAGAAGSGYRRCRESGRAGRPRRRSRDRWSGWQLPWP